MGLFDIFKKKEKEPTYVTPIDIPELPESSTQESFAETAWPSEFDVSTLKSAPVESLCKRIDLEVEDLDRRVKDIRKRVKELDLDNPEILDLLSLYEKMQGRLQDYLSEIKKFDSVGWGVDENTAALFKFRACKGLANIKKQIAEIEKISKEIGFTPSKTKEILKTPAEKLVENLAGTSRKKT